VKERNYKMRILLVEDNPDDVELALRELKKQANFKIDIAATGKECLEKLAEKSYDVVLLDYALPKMNGLEVLREIVENNYDVPVVMITGRGDEEVAVKAMKQGACDYVVKSEGYLTRLPLVIQNAIEKYKRDKERARLDREIKKTKEYLETLINSIDEGIMVINRDYVITDVNTAILERVKRTKEEVIGARCYEISHNSKERCKPPYDICPVKEVFETGKHSKVTHTYFNSEGNAYFIELSASPIRDKNGNISQVIEVSRDVTERVKLEEELKEYSEQLEQKVEERTAKLREYTEELLLLQKVNNALNSALGLDEILQMIADGITITYHYDAAGITLLDEDKQYLSSIAVSIDPSLLRKLEKFTGQTLLGYKTHLFEGSIYKELIDTKKPLITNDIVRVFEDFTDDRKLRMLAKGVAKITAFKSAIGAPLLTKDKVIGVLGVISKGQLTDKDLKIIQRLARQAGLAIERAILERKLRESEEKHRTLIETMNEGLWVIDENGLTTFVNRKMGEILEYSPEEMIGRDVFSFFDEENQERLKKELAKRANGESSVYEIEAMTKTGRRVSALIAGTPLFDEKGNPKGSFAVVADVTERKKLERRVYQSEKLASIGQLAAGIAHEINNPLTNISLNTEILLKKVDDDQIKEKLESIEEQVDLAASIIRNLLDFSRQVEPEVKAIDINKVLAKTLNMLSFHLKDIDVTKDFNSSIPKIKADASQLQEVFINIIVNAIQAMPDGGKLGISTEFEEPCAVISISDTGYGIPKEYIGKIFDPFFTTRDSRKGTGLGLFICYGIIEEHGGTIEVESEIGKGTTFTIKLPVGGVNGKNSNR
jgi:PAS domain S-box-containing protein